MILLQAYMPCLSIFNPLMMIGLSSIMGLTFGTNIPFESIYTLSVCNPPDDDGKVGKFAISESNDVNSMHTVRKPLKAWASQMLVRMVSRSLSMGAIAAP